MTQLAALQNITLLQPDGWFHRKQTLCIDQFSVEYGQVIALIGPNGAGKTTLLKMLAGLIKPQTGIIQMNAQRIVYVPHECTIPLYLTVSNALWYVAQWRNRDVSAQQKKVLLEQLGLMAYQEMKLSDLSYGMRQRVMIAQALLQQPDLLLLDEPFSGIDQHFYTLIEQHCLQLNKARKTVIYVTHHQLASSTDSVMLMQDGNIIEHTHFIAHKEFHDYFRP